MPYRNYYPCAIEGCDKPRHARGWCGMHWGRWRKYGDPLFVTRDWGNKKTAKVVTYEGLHWRLRKARGPARQYSCACGSPAEQWAYDHSDPNELTGESPFEDGRVLVVRYSLDLARYTPMCRSCHWKFDREMAANG